MVETDTPKVFATSALGIPRSTAASTLSLRSFEYAFMSALSHGFNTQASRCRLVKLPSIPARADTVSENAAAYPTAERRETTVQRLVRDTTQARRIKALYDHRCQVCGTRLEGLAGPYAEAAHIRPLGAPHHGPDTPDNILCLCPNHHVLLDHGGVGIGEDFSLAGEVGKLTVHPQHPINEAHRRYRRDHYEVDKQMHSVN